MLLGAFELITNEDKAGKCLWISLRRGMEYWPTPEEESKYLLEVAKSKRKLSFSYSDLQLPQTFEKMCV